MGSSSTPDDPSVSPSRRGYHRPVLVDSVLQLMDPQAGERGIDATVGGGGHARRLLDAMGPTGSLLGLDRDPEALAEVAAQHQSRYPSWQLRQSNFDQVLPVAQLSGFSPCDFILADLGVSSHQLDQAQRGFSFMHDGPVDMRMDATQGQSAADLIIDSTVAQLTRILRRLGEEPRAQAIARALKSDFYRDMGTLELAELVRRAAAYRGHSRTHPATRTFQALRMQVNDELGALRRLLAQLDELLSPGGRAAIISFHSLEDRMVKRAFRDLATACRCPPELPVCICGGKASYQLLTRRLVVASEQERAENPRARSAKLRVIKKNLVTE